LTAEVIGAIGRERLSVVARAKKEISPLSITHVRFRDRGSLH